jgi:glyoxylase-like metal-dependent hydrolase (beta-lactamase superfamily II)
MIHLPRAFGRGARASWLLAIGSAASLVMAGGLPAARIGALSAQPLKAGLYLLSSQAGNSVLRLSGNGLILVDGQRAADYADLLAMIRKIDKQPIVAVINTDHDAVHAGSNARFLAEKIPVIGQRNELALITEADPNGAPPSVTFEQDETMHFGRGHTDADTIVHVPDSKAVALGELYAAQPDPDYAAGGSLLEWDKALADVLGLDFSLAIPGRGAPVTRADVESLRSRLDSLVDRAARLVADGVPKDRFERDLREEAPGRRLDFTATQIDGFYDELLRAHNRTP